MAKEDKKSNILAALESFEAWGDSWGIEDLLACFGHDDHDDYDFEEDKELIDLILVAAKEKVDEYPLSIVRIEKFIEDGYIL